MSKQPNCKSASATPTVRKRAEHARELHAQALREQADTDAQTANWNGQEGDNSANVS